MSEKTHYEVTARLEGEGVDYETFTVEADSAKEAEEIVASKDGIDGISNHSETVAFRYNEEGQRVY